MQDHPKIDCFSTLRRAYSSRDSATVCRCTKELNKYGDLYSIPELRRVPWFHPKPPITRRFRSVSFAERQRTHSVLFKSRVRLFSVLYAPFGSRPSTRRLALGGECHLDISAVASCSASFGCRLSVGRPKQKFRQVLPRGESSLMAKLTIAARKKLPKSDFVEKSTRKYPIPDAAHARDALARSSGKPEHASVVAAVKRKFPKIKLTTAK